MTTVTLSRNWMACLEAIAASVKDQTLDGIGDDVTVQKEPFSERADQVRPGCYVTPTTCPRHPMTTGQDEVSYGCQISVIQGSGEYFAQSPERITGWLETIGRLFNAKRLCNAQLRSGDYLIPCVVEEPPTDWQKLQVKGMKLEGSAIVVRAKVLERRT
jgi:hypothetical protein